MRVSILSLSGHNLKIGNSNLKVKVTLIEKSGGRGARKRKRSDANNAETEGSRKGEEKEKETAPVSAQNEPLPETLEKKKKQKKL